MTTAIDTNILQALWSGSPQISAAAQDALEDASEVAELVICPAVYAELFASPRIHHEQVDIFLRAKYIRVDWMMHQHIWLTAANAYRGYSERRRKQERNEGPRRILADFLIGAHAVHNASSLITFDQKIYRAAFPALTIITPAIH